jgi:hypothetical protein
VVSGHTVSGFLYRGKREIGIGHTIPELLIAGKGRWALIERRIASFGAG